MGAVDATEWACAVCGCCIHNDSCVEKWICIKFCIKPELSYTEGIWVIPKAMAKGSWWWATSSRQLTCSCALWKTFGKTSNHPGDSGPLQPRFGSLWLLAFPQTKITFEREEISDNGWDSVKYDGAADGDWENCVRSQVPTLKGTEASLSYVKCFLYLVSSSVSASIFLYDRAGYLLDRL